MRQAEAGCWGHGELLSCSGGALGCVGKPHALGQALGWSREADGALSSNRADGICTQLRRLAHPAQLDGAVPPRGHVLAPGGLLFCLVFTGRNGNYEQDLLDYAKDEIIALDAQTLQLRHRFGQGLLTNAHELAVVGDELYVCDTNNSRLQVFSLNGEHRRSVTGEWRWPMYLSYAKGRLYLVEQARERPRGNAARRGV